MKSSQISLTSSKVGKKSEEVGTQKRRFVSYSTSIACALLLSFGIVWSFHSNPNLQSMMASVAQIGQIPQNTPPADLVVSLGSGSLTMVFGKEAEKVDTIEGIILTNPQQQVTLVAQEDTTILTEVSPGVWNFTINVGGKNIPLGTRITTITTNTDAPFQITLSDTQFSSQAEYYNLSNIIE